MCSVLYKCWSIGFANTIKNIQIKIEKIVVAKILVFVIEIILFIFFFGLYDEIFGISKSLYDWIKVNGNSISESIVKLIKP